AAREELAPVVEPPGRPRSGVPNEVVLDVAVSVVALVADQGVGSVDAIVEDGVVEVRVVDVVAAVVDRRPVEELHEVPWVVPVLAPADAHGRVEGLSPCAEGGVDAAAGKADPGDV